MSYEAKVFRVLIASPSDVVEEREIAVKTIQEWNDLNSPERKVVLLPLRWETHTAPEYGARPQEIINRQVVDHCDLVIGVFWTRIGSPTGVADSGTLEEIERVASKGHPVMLYFSQVKKDPNQIDLEQLAKLREFKDKTFPKALVESYNSQIEFRDKLAKQIEIQLRNLVAEESNSNNTADLGAREKIEIEFCDPKTGELLGSEINLEADFLDVSDIDDIPDYSSSQSDQDEDGEVKKIFRRSENRDYYRQYVEYVVKKSMYKNIGFSLKNNGVIGARDIFIDMDINVDGGVEELISNDRLELKAPKKEKDSSISFSLDDFGALASERLQLEGSDKDWKASFEIRALQPKRTVKSRQQFVVGAISDCVVNISAKIYADILPEPLIQSLKIDLKVNTIEAKSSEILQELGYELEDCAKSA
ncbi:hypothetical protein [Bacterioplanoides sp.]|uniref:hypothetical protein n=1 Tax=Bacterioplanoides sp. TaxID=2066072 RepID=UPI003B5C703A